MSCFAVQENFEVGKQISMHNLDKISLVCKLCIYLKYSYKLSMEMNIVDNFGMYYFHNSQLDIEQYISNLHYPKTLDYKIYSLFD